MNSNHVLDIKDFDPLKVDLTEIKKATNQIPQDGFIELEDAGRLATIFLVAADKCSDMITVAERWRGYVEAEKKAERARAIARKMSPPGGGKGVTGTVAKEAYGDDEEYLEVSKKSATAVAWLGHVTRQYELLNKYHHLCKGMLVSSEAGRSTGGWSEQGIYNHTESDLEYKKDGVRVFGQISWNS